jgi:hypothetical protein
VNVTFATSCLIKGFNYAAYAMTARTLLKNHQIVFGTSSFASVAQLVEQLICNQLVGGSSPSTGSYMINREAFGHVRRECAGVGEPGQTVNLVSLTE